MPSFRAAPATLERLADVLCWHAGENAGAPALRSPLGELSFAQLAARATDDAAAILAQGFASPDSAAPAIAAIAGGAHELLRAALACSFADIALAPLDPAHADIRWPALAALGGRHIRRASLCQSVRISTAGGLPRRLNATAAPALVIATSGSEGAPKAVMLGDAQLAAAARSGNERLQLSPGDVWLACLPLHHIGGMAIVHRCVRAGATISLHEGFDAASVWREIAAGGVSHVSLTPAMLARLLDAAGPTTPPPSLRHALIGGAALSRPLFARARAACWPLRPSWGMSESAAQAATLVAAGDDDWNDGDVGELLAGLECRIGDDGRLALRGATVMQGYLNPDLRPGDGLVDGWFVSSDLGHIAGERRISIVGRADDMLVSGGVNVHPLDIESRLAACPGVADLAVSARADPVWGDLIVALFVGDVAPDAVQAYARAHLASAQRPRRFLRVARLPRNALGKIERAALRALAGEAA